MTASDTLKELPENDAWSAFQASLSLFTEDFFAEGRNDEEQEREEFEVTLIE